MPVFPSIPSLDIQLFRPGRELESVSDDVWTILSTVDNDFVPPLSVRSNTTGEVLTQDSIWGGPVSYFETVMQQCVFLARKEGCPVGLLSFIPHYQDDALSKWSPSTHVTTTCVMPDERRQGIALALNHQLTNLPADLRSAFVTRRTWSTNEPNIRLLDDLGYEHITQHNDGTFDIDIVYLARRVS